MELQTNSGPIFCNPKNSVRNKNRLLWWVGCSRLGNIRWIAPVAPIGLWRRAICVQFRPIVDIQQRGSCTSPTEYKMNTSWSTPPDCLHALGHTRISCASLFVWIFSYFSLFRRTFAYVIANTSVCLSSVSLWLWCTLPTGWTFRQYFCTT